MAITDAEKAKINSMCIVAQDVSLGTEIQTLQNDIATLQTSTSIKADAYTVTADDQTAGTVSIATGKTINGFVVTIIRSGNDVTNKAAISASDEDLIVATNGTDYVLTAGDVINYVVF